MKPTAKAVELLLLLVKIYVSEAAAIVDLYFWSTCRPVGILQILRAKKGAQAAFFDRISWSE